MRQGFISWSYYYLFGIVFFPRFHDLRSPPAGKATIFTSSLSFQAQPNALASTSLVRDRHTIASACLVYSFSTQLYTLVQHPFVLTCAIVVPSMQGAYASPKHM